MTRSDTTPIARHTPRSPRRPPGGWTVALEGTQPRDTVGGKAEGLGKLMDAGFEIPRSFCVTTGAFLAVVRPLARRADDLEELREMIVHTPLPQELVDEIRERMAAMEATRWAVRSSGIAEDTELRSYAGQALSVLNVAGLDAVLEATRRVWASHFEMDRLLYLARGSLQISPRPAAVLIQEMLDPITAGVLFTVNPMTGDETEAVVTSARGLGEAVVTGQRGGTHYLDKRTGYVRRQATDDNDEETLSEENLRHLATCARGVEAALGDPRDIEWAYACPADDPHQARLYLLQARPITAEGLKDPGESVWTNANVGEALPGVATPLTWSIIHDFSRRGFEQAFGTLGLEVPPEIELVRSFQGRIYLSLTQFMSIASGQPLFKPERLFSMAGGGGVELVRDIYEQRSVKGFFKRLPLTIPKVLGAQLSMPLIAPLWGRIFTGKVEEFFDRDLTVHDRIGLAEELAHLDELFDRTGLVMLATSSNFLMSYVITAEILRFLGGQEAAQHEQDLFSGLRVKSAEPGLALLELGRMARRSLRLRKIICNTPPEEALQALTDAGEHQDVADFLAALDDFRKHHGHRAPREAELATPRWREDTSFLFEVVRSFVEAPDLPSNTEVDRERRRKRRAARQVLDRMLPGGVDVLVKAILAFTRSNARRREYMRDRVVDSLDIYRHFFLECGRRLADQGYLTTKEDVFYLTHDEISQWIQDPDVAVNFPVYVLSRQALMEYFKALPDPPDTFLLRGSETISADDAPRRLARETTDGQESYLELRGLAGSPGRVSGPARVILDPHSDDATIKPGEILVAPYTDVGWTPLFLAASGVVMSLGGPLSHSCIVAREYGIPAVVNAKQATEILSTGDWITVDGNEGVVYVRQDDPADDSD